MSYVARICGDHAAAAKTANAPAEIACGLQELALSDIPVHLLYKILSTVQGIDDLKTGATLAVVNKAFATAVRQQRSLIFKSHNLIGSAHTFSKAAASSLLAMFCNTTLQLQFVNPENFQQMILASVLCPKLQTFNMYLHPYKSEHSDRESLLCTPLWRMLHTQHDSCHALQQMCGKMLDHLARQTPS